MLLLNFFGHFVELLFLLNFVPYGTCHAEKEENPSNRTGKLLSVFQIVTFQNKPCFAVGNKTGTCYTSVECATKGGVSSGVCAASYGVCCLFSAGCGARISENCTYFEGQASKQGSCTVSVCRMNSNICQLRLDFNSFAIAGPETGSSSQTVTSILNGVPGFAVGVPVNLNSRCLVDTFSATNTGGTNPPIICGVNSGEHMYLNADVTGGCNSLVFQFGPGATTPQIRSWSIKVTQYSCNYVNLAPHGCTQFFYGQRAGGNFVQTYNYNDGMGQHLASQDQTICVRREQGQCRICWTTVKDTDFMLTGKVPSMGVNKDTLCCSYGFTGGQSTGFDCVNIPGAMKASNSKIFVPSDICGKSKGLVTTSLGTQAKTVCSTRTPFNIRFRSDAYEFLPEAATKNRGFRLTYFQDMMNCNN